jgi:hypothetical protein
MAYLSKEKRPAWTERLGHHKRNFVLQTKGLAENIENIGLNVFEEADSRFLYPSLLE